MPRERSEPLEPAVRSRRRWPHAAGVLCLGLGLASVSVAAVMALSRQALFEEMPDWRVTIPLWLAAIAAAIACGVRREGRYGLAVIGVALASGAVLLGWVLALAVVATVALVIIYLMSELF